MLAIFIVFCSHLSYTVFGAGTFQLKVRSVKNQLGVDSDGLCCSTGRRPGVHGRCPSAEEQGCRTRLRVCLMHYQTTVVDTKRCTYGEVVTPVLGTDSFSLVSLTSPDLVSDSSAANFSNPIQLPFSFAWPLTFSLIIEAWHELPDSKPTDSFEDRHSLVYRVTKQDYVDAAHSWKISESSGPQHAINFDYRVKCDKHYYGKSCNVFCKGSVNSTFGHYECMPDGTRKCLPGWTGDYCTKAVCLPGCHEQHGYCDQPNECKCMSGWQGQFCDQCRRYPNCAHGTCSNAWGCDCEDGWGGLFCNQDLNYCTNHRPCKNGATCHNSGAGSYQCTCAAGFSGADCEVEESGCAHQPCLNGGQCRDTGSNFTCVCPRGWSGHRCETAAETCADSPCKNGGSCSDHRRLQGYRCTCAEGFTGTNCERRVSVCEANTCGSHGKCVNVDDGFRCICEAGFTGQRCETNVDDCANNPCLHGGTCVDGINQFHCQCVSGFVGSVCHLNVDDCATSPCANGGHCYDGINDFTCTCRPGFIGKDCSINVDECVGQTCLNGGTCVDRVNGFECRCPRGFAGFMCQFEGAVPAWARPLTAAPGHTGVLQPMAGPSAEPLPARHVVLISTLSVSVPALVLVSIAAILCAKYRRRRAAEKADEEARRQNEQNACHGAASTCSGSSGSGKLFFESHMIVNTLDYPSGCGSSGYLSGGGSKVKNIDDPTAVMYMERPNPTKTAKQVNLDSCKTMLNTSSSSMISSSVCSSALAISDKYEVTGKNDNDWASYQQLTGAPLKVCPSSMAAKPDILSTVSNCSNLLRSPDSAVGSSACRALAPVEPSVHNIQSCSASDSVFATEV